MLKDLNLSGLIVIWAILNLFMIMLFLLLGIIPGINLIAVPILMFLDILMNMIFILWILMIIIIKLETRNKDKKNKFDKL